MGKGENDVPVNDIALRSDLHRLFDACLFTFAPEGNAAIPKRAQGLSEAYGAICDSNVVFAQPAPGNLNSRVLALNEGIVPGFGPREFRFFGIQHAKDAAVASFDNPTYYADKPRADIRKIIL